MKDRIARNFKIVLVIVAVSVYIFMHVYELTEIPFGYNIDEAAAAYDAFSIMNHGVDRFFNSLPVYFVNFGGGQSALYTYTLALFYKLFGVSHFVVRFVMVVAGLVTGLFGFLLVRLKFYKEWGEYLFILLYAIMPVITMVFRIGMDCHLMLCMASVFLYVFTKALETKELWRYIISGIIGGILLYSYVLSYVVTPLFLVITISYVIYISVGERLKTIGKIIAMGIPMGVIAIPLILVQVVNYFDLPEMKIGPFTITKLLFYRGSEISIGNPIARLWDVYKSTHISDILAYNSLPGYATLYYFSLPFIAIGFIVCCYLLVRSIQEKKFECSAIIVFWFWAEVAMGMLLGGNAYPNVNRLNAIYISLLYYLVVGLLYFIKRVYKLCGQKFSYIPVVAMVSICIAYLISFVSFTRYYFGDYTSDIYPMNELFVYSYEDFLEYLETTEQEYAKDTIYINGNCLFYMVSSGMDCYDYNLNDRGGENYNNIHFGFPEHLDLYGDYLVSRRDNSSIEYLTNCGYKSEDFKDYEFFISPLHRMEKVSLIEGLAYSIDTVKAFDEGKVEVSGWAYSTAISKPFETITLQTDSRSYKTELEVRSDVNSAYNLDDMSKVGFRCLLDASDLGETSRIILSTNVADFDVFVRSEE